MADATLGRIAVSVYQAFSQGYVRITTTDPQVDPMVEERMLSDHRDLVRLLVPHRLGASLDLTHRPFVMLGMMRYRMQEWIK